MALRFVGALALAPALAAGADGLPDTASMQGKCYSLLTGLSASRYSTDELTLLCRAHLPMEVCRAEAKELGAKPWSPSTIGRVCGQWEEDFTQRTLQMTAEDRQLEWQEFQTQIDDLMKQKNAVGLCKDQKTVEECANYKKEEYPKYQKQLNEAYENKRAEWSSDWMNGGESLPPPEDAVTLRSVPLNDTSDDNSPSPTTIPEVAVANDKPAALLGERGAALKMPACWLGLAVCLQLCFQAL